MGKRLQVGIHHQPVVLLIWLVADFFSAGLPARCERTHRVLNLLFVHVFSAIGLIRWCFLPFINIVRRRDSFL